MHFDEIDWYRVVNEALIKRIDDMAGGTVAGIYDQFQGLDPGGLEEALQVIDIVMENRLTNECAPLPHRGKIVFLSQALNITQAGIAADWPSTLAHELHAVVVHGVVAGCDLNAAIDIEMESGEVDLFSAGQSDIDNINTRIHQPLRYSLLERITCETHVGTDHHAAGLEILSEGAPDAPSYRLIQFAAESAANVIGLEPREFPRFHD
jgi:hypothetical protein